MKTKSIQLILCLLIMSVVPAQNAFGQSWLQDIGQGVKQRAKDRAKQKVEEKIYQKVDDTVDKAVDKAFESTEEAVNKAVDKTVDAVTKKVEAAADTLTAAVEAVAVAADDLSVEVAVSQQEKTGSDNTAKRAELMKKFAGRASGGQPFYPARKGLVMTYASGTGKGKADSYTRTTVTDISWKDERNFSVTVASEILDKDMNTVTTEPMTASAAVKDGIVIYDPGTMAGQLMEEMEISGDFFMLPDNIVVGDVLPDYSINVNISGLVTTTANSGIRVTGQETLTVSGHEIECYIIESTASVTALGLKSSMTSKVWYGRGIGQVRQESYNKKGKLMSVYELVELEGY